MRIEIKGKNDKYESIYEVGEVRAEHEKGKRFAIYMDCVLTSQSTRTYIVASVNTGSEQELHDAESVYHYLTMSLMSSGIVNLSHVLNENWNIEVV